MTNNTENMFNSKGKVDRANFKSLTNSKKYRIKKINYKIIQLINKINNQSKSLFSYISKIYLYLSLHDKMRYNLLTVKSIDFNLIIKFYLLKIDLFNSIDSLLLKNIYNFLYNNLQKKTNNNYAIDKNINLKIMNNNFYFKGLLINYFLINHSNLDLLNDKKNNTNFFNCIFEYLYLSIRIRHTNLMFNLLITNNAIISNYKIYNTNNIYERYYLFINKLKIYLYNKQNNNYNVTLKYNYFNITPYKMFDTHYFITNTLIRKNFNYDISPLYILFLNSYIQKTRYKFIINIICLLYI